jgi:hypothetical protein
VYHVESPTQETCLGRCRLRIHGGDNIIHAGSQNRRRFLASTSEKNALNRVSFIQYDEETLKEIYASKAQLLPWNRLFQLLVGELVTNIASHHFSVESL